MELVATAPLANVDDRMLTYSLSDKDGAKVIISVRAGLADDALVRQALNLLGIPAHPGS